PSAAVLSAPSVLRVVDSARPTEALSVDELGSQIRCPGRPPGRGDVSVAAAGCPVRRLRGLRGVRAGVDGPLARALLRFGASDRGRACAGGAGAGRLP